MARSRGAALLLLSCLSFLGCENAPDGPWSSASTDPPVVLPTADGRTRSVRLRAPYTGDLGAAARALIADHAATLGVGEMEDELGPAESRPLSFGGAILAEQLWFPRVHEGVEVVGAGVRVLAAGSEIRLVSAALPPGFALDVTPALDAAAAEAALADAVELARAAEPELVIFDRDLLTDATHEGAGGSPELAWRFRAYTRELNAPEELFVSATSGEVIFRAERTRDLRRREVYTARRSTRIDPLFSDESTRVQWIGESGPLPGVTPEPGEEAAYADAQRAYEISGRLYDFFARYQIEGFDDESGLIRTFVDFYIPPPEGRTEPGSNGFWSPRDDNDPTGASSGGFVFTPGMVADDVFMHEYVHALHDFLAVRPPVYWGEAGAYEEGIADGLAMVFDPDAQLAEDTLLGAQRDLADPHAAANIFGGGCYQELFPTFTERTWTCADCAADRICWAGQCVHPEGDSGGVHINSSIFARAIALLHPGVSAAAPYGSTCTQAGGLRTVSVPKLGYALTVATSLATYGITLHEGAQNTVMACLLMAGQGYVPPGSASPFTEDDCIAMINAFAAVGIGEADRDYDGRFDSDDECPDRPNPIPEPCDEDPPPIEPPEPQELPLPPPADPACPTEFTTSARTTVITEGVWPLAREAVEASMSTGSEGVWGGYSKLCFYTQPGEPLTATIELIWQPHDPADFGLVRHVMCTPRYLPLMLEAQSETRQATVRVQFPTGVPAENAEAYFAEFTSQAEAALAMLEPLAFECGEAP